jgi:hypothetical protein
MNPKASCGVLNPPLRGIVQLTNSAALRFRNWSLNNKNKPAAGYYVSVFCIYNIDLCAV